MHETTTSPISRWRMVTFWVLMVVLLVLYLGDRPQQLTFIVTAFGGFPVGAGATHEIHWFAQGVLAWVIVAAIGVQLRRPATQIGGAWVYGLGLVLAFSMVLALADLPAEVVPIVAAAVVVAALGFAAHPSHWQARFTSVAPPSRALFLLVALAAVPLVTYAVGQLDIHTGSGPNDEHYEFGHWVVMAAYTLLAPFYGAVAAWKVSGWRFPLWVTGIMVAALGIGSLGITAVSQLTTGWSLLAIVWGVAFIGVGELEARQQEPTSQPAQARRPVNQ